MPGWVLQEGVCTARLPAAEADFQVHLEVLRWGRWVEYDVIGTARFNDEFFVELAPRVLEAGFGDRLLLSQDVCGYLVDRAPHTDRPEYAYPFTDFASRLAAAGCGAEDRDRLPRGNPGRLFSLREKLEASGGWRARSGPDGGQG